MASDASRLALGALAAAVIGVGVIWLLPRPETAVVAPQQTDPAITTEDAPEVAESTADAPEAVETVVAPEPESVAEIAAPTVGMRAEMDGILVVTGRAPGAEMVDVLLGNRVIERLMVDGSGAFATVVMVEPSDKPRMLQVIADPEGAAVASVQNPLLLPTEIEQVAAASDEPIVAGAVIPVEDAEVAESTAISEEPSLEAVEGAVAVADDAPEADEVVVSVETTDTEPAIETATTENNVEVEVAEADDAPEADENVVSVETTDTEPVIETATTENNVEVGVAEADDAPEADEDVVSVETTDAEPAIETAMTEDNAEVEVAEATNEAVDPETDPVKAESIDPAAEPAEPEAKAGETDVATGEETDDTGETMLVADAEGVRVVAVDVAGPQVLTNVALDSISYDLSGEVLLTGRGTGDGFVQVYVDNQPVTTSRITAGGDWRTDLPEVDTGVYTLRIDELDEAGTVVSRIETPFKREEPEAVAAVMAEETAEEDFKVAVRTVQPGATLWAIAREQFGKGIMYVAVYEANKDQIRDPDLIYPGQVFRMPETAE